MKCALSFSYLLFTLLIFAENRKVESLAIMTWAATWKDILSGGSKRWKVDDLNAKKQALKHILKHSSSTNLNILCPLAGDDQFVHYAWSQGHSVSAIDLVPEALAELRKQFGNPEDWSSSSDSNQMIWKHSSGRVTLYEGDMMMKRPNLCQAFDAIYDKDSFGALTKDLRSQFCERLSEFCKDDATVYVEVKNKDFGKEDGPPFHVEKEDLLEMSNFGKHFSYVSSLGELYPLQIPNMKQTGHILTRLVRK